MRLAVDGAVPGGTNTDPLDMNTEEFLDELDVSLAVLGKLLERGAVRDVRFPTGESLVLNFDSSEIVKIGGETLDLLAVQDVLGGDLDFLKLVEDIQFGQVQTGVTVNEGRVSHDDQVEPTTTTSSTSGDTPLGSDFLQVNTDVVQLLRGEGTTTNSGGVGLDDTDDLLDDHGWDSKTGADTSDSR